MHFWVFVRIVSCNNDFNFLLYFFVLDTIAINIDEARANKDKINELEKRIDNIEKDK